VSEHGNATLMREGYAAFAAGDLDRIRQVFADDIVWHVGGTSGLAGDYKGQDEVFDFFGRLFEMTDGTFMLEIHDVVANDDHAVVLAHATARRGDRMLDSKSTHVWHVRDGRATEFWGFDWDQRAGDDFFS